MLFESYKCVIEKVKLNENEESYKIPDYDGARISNVIPPGKLLKNQYEDAQTLIEVIERGCRISENGKCVGWKASETEYSWLHFKEFMSRAHHFSSGLIKLGIQLGQSNRISIYGQNSIEWIVAQYACFYQSSPVVPLYDTIALDARNFMINQAETRIVVCDNEDKVNELLAKSEETPILKYIIHMDNISEETKKRAEKRDIVVKLFADIEELGKNNPIPVNVPKPTDVALICYTSGTTGTPKGCILTHQNIIAGYSGVIQLAGDLVPNKNDVSISYLPLAHIYEQVLQAYVLVHGGSVGFFSGHIPSLTDDMRVLQPTIFPTVPRVLNKLYYKIKSNLEKLQGAVKETNGKNEELVNSTKNAVQSYPPSVSKSILNMLGGKIRYIMSGAAPISEEVLTFFQIGLGVQIKEVYGQTECSGPCCINVVTPETLGSVGPPIPCNLIKLEDVPELGYFKKDNIGELCVKGPNVFSGYFKNPENTAEVLKEGWLHTGDVAVWLPNGMLKIVDRKKHIFKLAQGEYIMPEKIENIYLISPYISQILVHGDSLQSYLVAIVIPDETEVMEWCRKKLISGPWKEICSNKLVKHLILEDMKQVAKASGLLSFQQVKEIHLHPTPLTIKDGHLTSTQKIKRDIIRNFFMKEINAMYANTNCKNSLLFYG